MQQTPNHLWGTVKVFFSHFQRPQLLHTITAPQWLAQLENVAVSAPQHISILKNFFAYLRTQSQIPMWIQNQIYYALTSLSKYLPYWREALHGRLHLSLALSEPLECMLELWDCSTANKFGYFPDAEWGPWGLSSRENFILLSKGLPSLPPCRYWTMSSLNTINRVNRNVLGCRHNHIYKLCQSLRHGNSVEVAVFENVGNTFTAPHKWFRVWSIACLFDKLVWLY